MKREPVTLNVLDRAIGWFDPVAAVRRAVARKALSAAGGGYNAARRDRASMATASIFGGSPESDVIADLPKLRAASREAERNHPVGTAAIGTTVSHSVGTGLSCNPSVNAKFLGLTEDQAKAWQENTAARFAHWASAKDADLGRRQTFYELQDLVLRTVCCSGDTLVVTPMVQRAGETTRRLALQVIEADRISNPSGKSNTANLTEGVECDATTGEAVAYHVCSRHPGDFTAGALRTWDRIAARGAATGRLNALHIYKVLRPDLRRGVPILGPVLEPLRQLSRFAQAERAKQQRKQRREEHEHRNPGGRVAAQHPHPGQVAGKGAHAGLHRHDGPGLGAPGKRPGLAHGQRHARQAHRGEGDLIEQQLLGRDAREVGGADRHRGQPPEGAGQQAQQVALGAAAAHAANGGNDAGGPIARLDDAGRTWLQLVRWQVLPSDT